MAIIFDNTSSDNPKVIMANDGHGHLVEIPSIFISGKHGKLLKEAMKDCNGSVILQIQFETFKSPVANTTFWMDTNHVVS